MERTFQCCVIRPNKYGRENPEKVIKPRYRAGMHGATKSKRHTPAGALLLFNSIRGSDFFYLLTL